MEPLSESRFANLETQVAYNEETLSELNRIVTRQADDIDRLKKEVEILGRQILEMTEGQAANRL